MNQSVLANAPSALPEHWVDQHPERLGAPLAIGWHRDLHALAAVLFAKDEQPPPDARLNWTVRQIDDMLEKIGGRGRFVYRMSLRVVSWLAPLLVFSLPKLRRLSFEKRAHALERFEAGPAGMMLFALKAMLCIVYYEHPDAAREIGFDGRGLLEGDDV